MIGPYCNSEMQIGRIFCGSYCTYWLPEGTVPTDFGGFRLTTEKVEEHGGFVLGEAQRFSLLVKRIPASYYCPDCRKLITDLDNTAKCNPFFR